MTDQEINIAIAEVCGWIEQDESKEEYRWLPPPPDNWQRTWRNKPCFPPSYTTDLNAMHEAEKVLLRRCGNDPQSDMWIDYLANLLISAPCCLREHATARQRAEAFLRTVSKWKE